MNGAGQGRAKGKGSAAERLLPARIGALVKQPQYRLDPLGFRHPILKAFRGRGESALLTTPVFQYYKLEIPKDSAARKVLALGNGDPLMVEESIERGRVVLVATSAEVAWSGLPLWPSFVPLMQEMLSYCMAGEAKQRNLTVGEPIAVTAAGRGGRFAGDGANARRPQRELDAASCTARRRASSLPRPAGAVFTRCRSARR